LFLKKQTKIEIAAVAVLIFFLLLQSVFSMAQKSVTSDETTHLSAGYSYLKTGDYRINPQHPPLIKLICALPLLFLNPELPIGHASWQSSHEWQFGEQFMYNNKVSAQKLIFWGRMPAVLLSALLACLVYFFTAKFYGSRAGIYALLLYVFSPNIIAHSRLVNTDLGITLFCFASVWLFWMLLHKPALLNAVLFGIASGLALSAKFSALLLIPLCFAILVLNKFTVQEKPKRNIVRYLMISIGISLMVVALCYGFTSVPAYFSGLKQVYNEVKRGGYFCYLAGRYNNTGWWYYYIVALLVKTPLPALVLFVATLIMFFQKKALQAEDAVALMCFGVFFLTASLGNKQIGLRYILPVFPFMFFLMGKAVARNIHGKPIAVKAIFILLLIWYVVTSLRTFPHYLPYFNELAGGPENGSKYLLDSNIDWGQDLIGLRKFLQQEERPEIILAYFGSASPRAYNITYQNLSSYNLSGRKEDTVNSLYPKKEYFVISINIFKGLVLSNRNMFSWLEDRPVVKKIGYTLYLYDITRDAEAHYELGRLYGGDLAKAEREFRRTVLINKSHIRARYALGLIYRHQKKFKKAQKEFEEILQIRPEEKKARRYLEKLNSA
jgi:tetratricopeptide (TPR) repeat protein